VRQLGPHAVEDACQRHVQDQLPCLVSDLVDKRRQAGSAGVVMCEVQAADGRHRVRDRRVGRGRVRHVAWVEGGRAARPLDEAHGLCAALRVDVTDQHARALRRELLRARPPDTRSGAGDQCDLPSKLRHSSSLSPQACGLLLVARTVKAARPARKSMWTDTRSSLSCHSRTSKVRSLRTWNGSEANIVSASDRPSVRTMVMPCAPAACPSSTNGPDAKRTPRFSRPTCGADGCGRSSRAARWRC